MLWFFQHLPLPDCAATQMWDNFHFSDYFLFYFFCLKNIIPLKVVLFYHIFFIFFVNELKHFIMKHLQWTITKRCAFQNGCLILRICLELLLPTSDRRPLALIPWEIFVSVCWWNPIVGQHCSHSITNLVQGIRVSIPNLEGYFFVSSDNL